jgi:hypothetical protein
MIAELELVGLVFLGERQRLTTTLLLMVVVPGVCGAADAYEFVGAGNWKARSANWNFVSLEKTEKNFFIVQNLLMR